MTDNFHSNLSRIKPKLRTQGNVTGNFGRPKSKANSPMKDIGVTGGNVGSLPKREDYLETLRQAYRQTDDPKLKQYIYQRIRELTF